MKDEKHKKCTTEDNKESPDHGKTIDYFQFPDMRLEEYLSDADTIRFKSAFPEGPPEQLKSIVESFAKKAVKAVMCIEIKGMMESLKLVEEDSRRSKQELQNFETKLMTERTRVIELELRFQGYQVLKEDYQELQREYDVLKSRCSQLQKENSTTTKKAISSRVKFEKSIEQHACQIEDMQIKLGEARDESAKVRQRLCNARVDHEREIELKSREFEIRMAEKISVVIESTESLWREKVRSVLLLAAASADETAKRHAHELGQLTATHAERLKEKETEVAQNKHQENENLNFDITTLFPRERDEDLACSTCQDADAQVTFMPCGHKEQCIRCAWNWQRQPAGNTCPKCRGIISCWT